VLADDLGGHVTLDALPAQILVGRAAYGLEHVKRGSGVGDAPLALLAAALASIFGSGP
jgi:hypothetical protein